MSGTDIDELRGNVQALHNARQYLLDQVSELEDRIDDLEARLDMLEQEVADRE